MREQWIFDQLRAIEDEALQHGMLQLEALVEAGYIAATLELAPHVSVPKFVPWAERLLHRQVAAKSAEERKSAYNKVYTMVDALLRSPLSADETDPKRTE